MTKRAFFPVLAAATLLAACTMAPKYERPVAPAASGWPAPPLAVGASGTAAPTTTGPVSDLGWREFFGDPRLQALLALALQNNRDLRVATLNVQEVAARYRIQRAALFPQLDANGALNRTQTPSALLYTGEPALYSIYGANVGITSWELDFFGRIRSLKEQALQTYFAEEQNRRSAQLSLVAQVATEYYTDRALAEEIGVARATLRAQQDSLGMTQRGYEVGSFSEIDFRTAQAQVASARSDLASLLRQRSEALQALAVLVGGPPPDDLPSAPALADDALPAGLPAGLPSDLLNRRPDILAAEHQLRGYNANIGAARAAFFPKITLTASGGTESLTLSGLFKPGSADWTFAPQITLPIFDAGTNLANLDLAKLEKLSAIAQYEKTIQVAFQEVANALTARGLLDDQIAAQRALVAAEQVRYNLAEARYRQGVDNYLTELDAQRSLYSAQQSLIQSRFDRLSNLITLYKALGGGWTERSLSEAASRGKMISSTSAERH